jgi:hypothetical protein
MNSPQPIKLIFKIGGYSAPSYSISLINNEVQYELVDGFKSTVEIAKPSAKQWLEFHSSLSKIQVWNWRAEYPNIGVCDGTQWEFEVAYDDEKIKSVGDNNYPLENGEPSGNSEYSKVFKRLVKAIKKLIGGLAIEL